ncbi:MAG: YihY/virulence factor BrkB family protein [Microbacteriaceae bacterium]|nr:YihY/virulence factor BrkB family protein [Microbacteriaceae bacterium]MCL2794499.1 YihY/virulence factor BrkB family protein [Microbacteriaceae bacterium]
MSERQTAERQPTDRVEQVRDAVQWARGSRVTRVVQRFNDAEGPLLAAGMAYRSIFALFAAVWVGFSIAGIWVRSNPALYSHLIGIVNHAVPNLIGEHGAISQRALDNAGVTLTLTGIAAVLVLIWTALGWLNATRRAIRAIFDVGPDKRNFFVQRGIDAVQALAFSIGLLASALVSVLTMQLVEETLHALGFSTHSMLAQVAYYVVTILVTLLINFGTLAGMYRVLSRLYIPWRNLFLGSALGAVALTVLSQASSYLLRGATRNPLLATFGVFVGLLLWFNFVCMVILIGASWISVGMEDAGLSARRLSAAEAAHEQLRAAYARDLDAAREDVVLARARLEATTGWGGRRRARAALRAALRNLQQVTANDPTLR